MALELQLPQELEKEALAYAAWQEQTLEGLFTSWLEETIKADQAWYWSEGWQRAEREAEADLGSVGICVQVRAASLSWT